ncbi:ABC transporter permease [Paenibacillus sp. GCM10023252]|uniref:ABC transporter permease n=1 Tax=Paenibacillus sp. GCM10023252 TaxID=3252649 RepID=UPI00360DE0FD
MDADSLRNMRGARARAWLTESRPYLQYMAQSGFTGFVILCLIMGSIGYTTLILNLPDSFPVTAVGIIALTPVLAWSPLRTYLVHADMVFLMPREGQMGEYMGAGRRNQAVFVVLLTVVITALYLPIYRQGDGEVISWQLAAVLLLLRWGNLRGSWIERELAWPNRRIVLRLLRWAGTGAVVAALLEASLWKAGLFGLLVAALLAVLYRLPSRHAFPWERLMEEEAGTRRRYYTFYGMFIDVPTLPSRAAKRPYLSWMNRLVRYGSRQTFHYLYTSTLVRTEIGGMLIRLLLLGMLVIYWLGDAAALSGWGAAAVHALFVMIAGLQLSALRQVHQYSVWRHVYPLPESRRHDSVVEVDRFAMLVCSVLLWLPLGLTLLLEGEYMAPAVALVWPIVYICLIRPGRLRRKMMLDLDEE